MSERHPLPPADSAWLHMERPDNLMTITGVMTFASRLPVETMRRIVRERLLRHPRFSMRVASETDSRRRPWFEPCEVDLDYHVRSVELPQPADTAALQRHVSSRLGTPLDHARPLWRFDIIELAGGGSALVGRIHHCIGDGMSLLGVMLELTDEDRSEVGPESRPPTRRVSPLVAGLRGVPTVGRLLTQPADPPTSFRGELGVAKRAVWSERYALDDIRAVAASLGGTINDVLLTAVAGGMHRYLARDGALADDLAIRAVVPFDLRGAAGRGPLTNRFGLVFLPLPVGRRDVRTRFDELKRAMDRIKTGPEAPLVFALLRAVGVAGPAVQRRVVEFLGRCATAIVTNVPGPRRHLHMAGVRIDDLIFWVPQSGDVGLGLSIFSYAGGVRVGLAADERRVPDPERLLEDIGEALVELHRLAESPGAPRAACG